MKLLPIIITGLIIVLIGGFIIAGNADVQIATQPTEHNIAINSANK